ncbi:MAG TPA: hypothetical protein PLN53_15405, partial [Terricaulis sp.]|nr:hypothetical protein [Terricaulis sp.]
PAPRPRQSLKDRTRMHPSKSEGAHHGLCAIHSQEGLSAALTPLAALSPFPAFASLAPLTPFAALAVAALAVIAAAFAMIAMRAGAKPCRRDSHNSQIAPRLELHRDHGIVPPGDYIAF